MPPTTDEPSAGNTAAGGAQACAACEPAPFCVDDVCVDASQGATPDPYRREPSGVLEPVT